MDLDLPLQQIADELRAAGVRAVVDERDVNPPCVLVTYDPSGGAFDRLDPDAWGATIWLRVVAPASGRKAAWRTLGPLVAQVRAVIRTKGWAPADFVPTDGGDPMPGVTLTYPVRATTTT